MSKIVPDKNEFRQWLEGQKITKKPQEMSDKELVNFTSAGAVIIIQRMKTLAPYLREVRRRFNKLQHGETLCGYRNWGEYCAKHLKKTKRAMNYMLLGGNKNRPQLNAPREDEREAAPLSAQRQHKAWQEVETVIEILGEAERLFNSMQAVEGDASTRRISAELVRQIMQMMKAAREILADTLPLLMPK